MHSRAWCSAPRSRLLCLTHGLLPPAACCQAVVFARMSPRHKELLVARLNSLGHTTLMCGDGTNDVGALTQAHIGTPATELLSYMRLPAAVTPSTLTFVPMFVPILPPGISIVSSPVMEAKLLRRQERAKKKLGGDTQSVRTEPRRAALSSFALPPPPCPRAVADIIMGRQAPGTRAKGPAGGARAPSARCQPLPFSLPARVPVLVLNAFRSIVQQQSQVIQFGDASIAAPFTSKRPTISSCTLVMG